MAICDQKTCFSQRCSWNSVPKHHLIRIVHLHSCLAKIRISIQHAPEQQRQRRKKGRYQDPLKAIAQRPPCALTDGTVFKSAKSAVRNTAICTFYADEHNRLCRPCVIRGPRPNQPPAFSPISRLSISSNFAASAIFFRAGQDFCNDIIHTHRLGSGTRRRAHLCSYLQ